MYVARRGDRWWFRKAVPVDLVDVLGMAEVRRSLRTRDARVARRRALEVLVRVEDVYAVLRSEHPLRPARDVALAMLEQALATNSGTEHAFAHKGHLLRDAASALRRTGDGDRGVGSRLSALDTGGDDGLGGQVVTADDALLMLRAERPRDGENGVAVAILEAVARLGAGRAAEAAAGARELDAALAVLAGLRADVGAPSAASQFAEIKAMLAGHLARLGAPPVESAGMRGMVQSEVQRGVARAEAERWSGMPLSEAIAKFEAVEVCKRGGAKHQEDVPRRLASFLRAVGDKPIRDISRDDVRAYRDLLDQAPDRFVLRFKTDDVREAVAANRKRNHPFAAIKKPTVDLKYLGPVGRLFQFLVKEKLLGSNPADGIRSEQKEESSAKAKRLPLKPRHIEALLAYTAREPVVTAAYWLPVIMLFSGARPGEIAQLKVGDLRATYNGRPHLNVLCLEDDEEDEPDVEVVRKPSEDTRRVKTRAGHRLIPIHPMLVRMGLLDLFQRRGREVGAKGQLFKDAKPNQHGHYSAALTRRLNRRLCRAGITNKRFVVYSLRHNFIDACHAARMPDVTRHKIVGHQMEGMAGIYGNPRPDKWESDWIDKVAYEGLDLNPYLPVGGQRMVVSPKRQMLSVRRQHEETCGSD